MSEMKDLWLDRRFMARSEWPSDEGQNIKAAFQKWKFLRLAETIELAAYSSPWYAGRISSHTADSAINQFKLLAETSIPDSRNTAASIAGILNEMPSPSAADLAADSDSFLAVGQNEIEGVVSVPSSGTSGPAKRLYSTSPDLEETIRFFEYGMRFIITPSADRVALAMSSARPGNVADLLGRAMERLNVPFLALGFMPENCADEEDEWVRRLAEWRPTCLVGVPAQMLSLSRHELAAELSGDLRTILLSGDVASDLLVSTLAENFRAEVFRHYGLTETGLGGAVECGFHLWPHIRDDLLIEILDRNHRPVASPHDRGEIAITTLTRRAMPLIRYRTGDEGRLLSAPCPCRSIFQHLETHGRLGDHLLLENGRDLRTADFEEPLLKLPFVRDYNLRLSGANSERHLTITIRATKSVPAEAKKILQKSVAEWLGQSATLLPFSVEFFNERADCAFDTRITGKRRLVRE